MKGWGLAALAVAGAWAVSMAAVNAGTIAAYAAETESSVPWGEEAAYSFSYVLHHPYETAKIFYQTLLWQLEVYHRTMIGGYLGNLDEILDVPYGAVVLFTVCLLCLAMKKPGESQRMSAGNRIWIGVLVRRLRLWSHVLHADRLDRAEFGGHQRSPGKVFSALSAGPSHGPQK